MIDSYREKGSSAALNVASQCYEVGELGGSYNYLTRTDF
ncbi:hypothetical protein C4K04_0713 [Pseudomonas chlororaphis]|uniref:Uncharacterized protein n=1 Tax=Pseudomonas chlororaphis TaxID=587753 RepID=A0A3G7TH30_9PSED|nr:hypothetical protein C4K04_0713 [Pseudomonas chlororaphis]